MRRWRAWSAALALAAAGSGFERVPVVEASLRAAPTPDSKPGAARPPCCFTNTQYAGTCQVEPAEGETCASILSYLNNPQSQGKSYCGSTSTRGGWKQRTCAKGKPDAPK